MLRSVASYARSSVTNWPKVNSDDIAEMRRARTSVSSIRSRESRDAQRLAEHRILDPRVQCLGLNEVDPDTKFLFEKRQKTEIAVEGARPVKFDEQVQIASCAGLVA